MKKYSIKEILIKSGYTQKDLGLMTGLGATKISVILNGWDEPTEREANLICNMLKVPVSKHFSKFKDEGAVQTKKIFMTYEEAGESFRCVNCGNTVNWKTGTIYPNGCIEGKCCFKEYRIIPNTFRVECTHG